MQCRQHIRCASVGCVQECCQQATHLINACWAAGAEPSARLLLGLDIGLEAHLRQLQRNKRTHKGSEIESELAIVGRWLFSHVATG
jgi:hypothetical protein